MSMEDYALMHRMIEKERSERMAETILSGYLSNLESTPRADLRANGYHSPRLPSI